MKSTWSVVVIYESAEAQRTAMAFCDQLVQHFWSRYSFDIDWVSFKMLANAPAAENAVERAAQAEFVVFSNGPFIEPPPPVKQWVDLWLQRRAEKEGTLIALTTPRPVSGTCAICERYYRRVAHRAGMDFAAEVPQNISPVPEGTEPYLARASQGSSVLDGILRQHRNPPVL